METPKRIKSPGSAEDIAHWDRIAEHYTSIAGTSNDHIYAQFKYVLWQSLGDIKGLHVLDVGCGHGWFSKALSDAGANVYGVDGSTELLKRARDIYQHIQFAEYDLTKGLPSLGKSFDRIIAHMVLMDIPDISELVSAIRGSIKADGKFIFTLTHPCFFHYRPRRDEVTGEMFRMVTRYLQPETWFIDGMGGHNHYHRSLTYYFEHLRLKNFAVTRLYEPPEIPDPARGDVEFYTNIPYYILIEAIPI